METLIDCVGWAPIEPAAAKADANFLAEYKTGVETPGNAGVAKAPVAPCRDAARAARDGLSTLRRSEWMTWYSKVAFIIRTTGHVPQKSRHPSEYLWLYDVRSSGSRCAIQPSTATRWGADRADLSSRSLSLHS